MTTTCVPPRNSLFRGAIIIIALALGLPGCSTLPVSGPTGSEIRKAAIAKPGQYPFTLVEVEGPATVPLAPSVPLPTLTTFPPRPTDLLGPGDVLNISIYEAGVALFGNSPL